MKKNSGRASNNFILSKPISNKKKEGGKNEQKQNHIPRWSRASHRIDN
jgi:hypothetical protein